MEGGFIKKIRTFKKFGKFFLDRPTDRQTLWLHFQKVIKLNSSYRHWTRSIWKDISLGYSLSNVV